MGWLSRYSKSLWLLLAALPTSLAAQGGGDEHWAYASPRESTPPTVEDSTWPRNPVDRFVLAAIERDGRQPSPEADPRTLVRRLYFDLLGLPPSAAETEAFVADPSDDAYERLVDRLLGSEHHAERLAMHWLDLVRYADTTGVHGDNSWDIHPYRDWVIGAFRRNQPFDQFTRDQLAGDLVEGATRAQRVAAAYNRLNLITREGGSQPKEFLVRYTADRVRNASTVWLAATVGCAECHDHKFDPIEARDFYRFGAFFADIQQVGVYSQGAAKNRYFGPYLPVPTADERARLEDLDRRMQALRAELDTQTAELDEAQRAWERKVAGAVDSEPRLGVWHASGPYAGESFDAVHDREFGPEQGVDLLATATGEPLWRPHPEWHDGKVHKLQGNRTAFYLFRTIDVDRDQPLTLRFGSDDSIRVWIDGREELENRVSRGVAPDQEKLEVTLTKGRHELLVKICNGGGGFGFYFRAEVEGIPAAIAEQLRLTAEQREPAGAESVARYFRSVTPLLAEARGRLAALQRERAAIEDSVPVVMATVATTPMTIRLLPRGDWMDDSGEIVQPGMPAAFGAMPAMERRATRLDLAEWLVAPDNPLVARVFVNRLWKLFYGRGIVSSLDDFGSQGTRPTHPELLDWLALRFVRSGWDVRAMVRLLVTSAAYRQASACDAATAERDPYNRLFSRQARYRHDAEVVRDNALAVSGLLVRTVGGRSVRPYQPAGFYRHLNFPKRSYQQDTGDDLWRRSVYTHWQRQYLHPSLAAFDAPSREECTVERARSNTPLQALVLLNDPIFVEAARALATRMIAAGESDVRRCIGFAFETVLGRSPTTAERQGLLQHHRRLLEQYRRDPASAEALLAIGEHPVPADTSPIELAAMTGVARVMLCLHESLTRY